MSLVVTQEGASRLLTWILSITPPVIPVLHLLGQPFNPAHHNTLSDFAANEVGPGVGYAPLPLSSPRANWSLSGLVTGYQAQYVVVNWTFTGAATVFGYYVSDDSFAVSLWGELLAASFPYGPSGGVFALQLPVQLTSQPATS